MTLVRNRNAIQIPIENVAMLTLQASWANEEAIE